MGGHRPPSSRVVEHHTAEPDISFISPMEWVGDGEGGDFPERVIVRFEVRRLERMGNERHVRDMAGNVRRGSGVATINGCGYGAVGEGLATKRNLMADNVQMKTTMVHSRGSLQDGAVVGWGDAAAVQQRERAPRTAGRERTERSGDSDWMTE
ncbi:putative multidrug resistance-associated protein letha [Sesbania bispinosa]|nr:putative multidrug resistance-associated protein letha [Sesbania bispinosa]